MILHRYVFREMFLTFLLTFTVVTTLALLGAIFKVFQSFEGLGLAFVLQTMPMAVGYVAPWALVVASCTAPTLVYGRMTADNEIDAMRLSGIPLRKIILPAIAFGIVLAAIGWIIVEQVAPMAHYHRRKAIRESIQTILKDPPPGKQEFKFGSYRLIYLDCIEGKLISPIILQHGLDWLQAEYKAESGYAVVEPGRPPRIVLSRPTVVRYDAKGGVHRFTYEGDFPLDLKVEAITTSAKGPEDMNLYELVEEAGRTLNEERRAEIWTIYHSRFARAGAPLLLVLVGAPIGIFVRKGARLAGLGAAAPPLLVYFVSFLIFKGMGEQGRIDPLAAAWAPDLILAAAASILLWGACRR